MLLEYVFEACARHRPVACIEEKLRYGSTATNGKPRSKVGTGSFPDRQYPLTPTFAEDSNRRLRLQNDLIDFQPDQLGDSESCDKA
jgi:hypothetical protein